MKIAKNNSPFQPAQKKPPAVNLTSVLFFICAIILFFSNGIKAQSVNKNLDEPVLIMNIPATPSAVPIMGSKQLLYELHIANKSDETVFLDQLQVLDVKHGKPIKQFTGKALKNRIFQFDALSENLFSLAPGNHAVVYVEITTDDGIPEALEHRIIFHTDEQSTPKSIRGGRIPIQTKPLPVMGLPLRGGPWVAVYSPEWKRGHRRVYYTVDGKQRIPGRYAIDWIKVNAAGKKAIGDKNVISNWFGYGADVLAVADGKIAAVRNDYPESPTISEHKNPPPEEAAGNYIVLNIGNGRYVFYEHLMPGSIHVKAGDSVKRGQVIAALGYTGQTTGPHLHIQVANSTSYLGSEGQPYVLTNFEVAGFYKDISKLGKAVWVPLKDSIKALRTKERPASNAVVYFE